MAVMMMHYVQCHIHHLKRRIALGGHPRLHLLLLEFDHLVTSVLPVLCKPELHIWTLLSVKLAHFPTQVVFSEGICGPQRV